MKEFSGKLAVITGGGTGMGRDLARLLAEEGCDVAICDVSTENMAETQRICDGVSGQGVKISTHLCDVAKAEAVQIFRDEVLKAHDTDHINLLFNNAGVGGGLSFVTGDQAEWERTFAIDWGGVYNCTRAFMPLLIASSEGHLVNTSSVNGFWASLGPHTAHTAYATAKFAVKGFSEALVNDLRLNAPHVKVSVVMPGHVGTPLVANSSIILGNPEPEDMTTEDIAQSRAALEQRGFPVAEASDDEIKMILKMAADTFNNDALTSSEDAARIILDGVREERWRILVGGDAEILDQLVREIPDLAYDQVFFDKLTKRVPWTLGN